MYKYDMTALLSDFSLMKANKLNFKNQNLIKGQIRIIVMSLSKV